VGAHQCFHACRGKSTDAHGPQSTRAAGALARPALPAPRHAETAGGGAGGCPAAGGGGSRATASPSAGAASAGLARHTLCSWYRPVQPTNTLAAAKFQLTGVITNDQRVQMMPVQARAVGALKARKGIEWVHGKRRQEGSRRRDDECRADGALGQLLRLVGGQQQQL